MASEYGLPEGTGARIGNVRNGSPAAEAGLRGGDVIVGYDGRSVTNAHELYDWITYSRPGTRTELEILRPGDGRRRVAVTLGEVPAAAETERGSPQ
jgi:serine protease Do